MKQTGPAIWAIVPAFNEASMIGQVVDAIVAKGYLVVVVDDGSLDDTAVAAQRSGAAILKHPINLGQGAALQTGIDFALARGADYILTLDADGQHCADDLNAMLAPLLDGSADFTLGSRQLGETIGMPYLRRLLLKAATLFSRWTSGMTVTDAHNGLRGLSRRGAQCIALKQNRMAHASEILDQIAKSELSYVEVPVTIRYSAYSLEKGQRLSGSIAILLDLAVSRIRR